MKDKRTIIVDPVHKYFEGVSELTEPQRNALEPLFSFIRKEGVQAELVAAKADKNKVVQEVSNEEVKTKMTEDEAATVLQRIWRTRLLANAFFSAQGREVYWEMLEDKILD